MGQLHSPDPSLHRYLPLIPFPPYRHLPGVTPHPHTHPDGHNYNAEEEYAGPSLTVENWRKNDAYLYGVDLCNHAYWWEAHEAWEGLWKLEGKESLCRVYLQGLIQTAAALIKWRQGNRRGVEKLWEQAKQKLERVDGEAPVYMGLDIASFVTCAERSLFASDGAQPPLIRLS